MVAMGFAEDRARAALEAAGNDVERAVEFIVGSSEAAEHPPSGSQSTLDEASFSCQIIKS